VDLLVIGCSARKTAVPEPLPAILRYDGPFFRDLRAFLRRSGWPEGLRIAVLSAEHGLIGALDPIQPYERRLDSAAAQSLLPRLVDTLRRWSSAPLRVTVVASSDYSGLLQRALESLGYPPAETLPGGLLAKRAAFNRLLARFATGAVPRRDPAERPGRLCFFPDWGDFVDPSFDFVTEQSRAPGSGQKRCHVSSLLDEPICDGILVSLAQRLANKGPLERPRSDGSNATAPENLRRYYALRDEDILFGDCGAFSYVRNDEPTITVHEAAFAYHVYGFDLGASVDHIPAPMLPLEERSRRLRWTLSAAEDFWRLARTYRSFHPVGVAHGITARDYARAVGDLVEMGYRHIGIGGLVFRHDREIAEIVQAVAAVRDDLRKPLWLHLFGIFRPRLQALFRELRIDSFDSASYYRKAWLRSDQNYLGIDGQWYTAIRVPVSRDPRNRRKLAEKGLRPEHVVDAERRALEALVRYEAGRLSLEETLDVVLVYDSLFERNDLERRDLRRLYERTLRARPWERCPCAVCRAAGIHIVIFRGAERNRRRGVHNMHLLYRKVRDGERIQLLLDR
jgi:hypothetical protein